MKIFHQNILISLAICLCGLCAYQWYIQSLQYGKIEKLAQSVAERNAALQDATNAVKNADHQIGQLDARLTDYKKDAGTHAQIIAEQKRALLKLQIANDRQAVELADYQKAVDSLAGKLKRAYGDIQKQDDNISQLVTQRDDLVAKYNASVKDRNDVVGKYNDFVKQIEKQQASRAGSHAGKASNP